MSGSRTIRQSLLAGSLAVSCLACGSDDPVAPRDATLEGSWRFVGFTDGDRVASSSGTWVFFEDGLMALDIQFTFPNETTALFAAVGTWVPAGPAVTFEIRGRLTEWTMAFSGDEVFLIQTAPEPADNTITLRRP